jgi:signal transduction histidine kinase
MGTAGKTREELEKEVQLLTLELKKAKDELDTQSWGLKKTNEAIKVLYKELEKQNKELQKLDQMKSDFVYAVSHELRTPLTTIREAVSQMLDGILGPINEDQRDFMNICLEDIDRLKRIIDNLLDIARFEAAKVKLEVGPTDIVAVAGSVLNSFKAKAKNTGIALEADLPEKKIIITADKDRITQVFTNLVGNSFKFTQKGTIKISVKEKENCVECYVEDTGKGFLKENLPKIFGKFQQFNRIDGPGEKGTGLGLSISRSIIDLHKGEIWVESEYQKGAKFIFTLPKTLELKPKDINKAETP